jgi:hypothetical protein
MATPLVMGFDELPHTKDAHEFVGADQGHRSLRTILP